MERIRNEEKNSKIINNVQSERIFDPDRFWYMGLCHDECGRIIRIGKKCALLLWREYTDYHYNALCSDHTSRIFYRY